MDELEISGRRFISTARAAKEHKYHADYIGQLVRGGKVEGQKVGRAWYIGADSLAAYLGQEAPAREAKPKKEEAPEEAEPAVAEAVIEKEEKEKPVEEKEEKEKIEEDEPEVEMLKKKFKRRPHVIESIAYAPVKIIEVEEVAEEKEEPVEIAIETAPEEIVEEEPVEAAEEEIFIPVKVARSAPQTLEDSFYKIPKKGLKYIASHSRKDISQPVVLQEQETGEVEEHFATAAPEPAATVEKRSHLRASVLVSMVLVAGIVSLSAGVLVSYYLYSNTTVDTAGEVSGLIFSQ